MCVYGRGEGCVCAEGRVLPPHMGYNGQGGGTRLNGMLAC